MATATAPVVRWGGMHVEREPATCLACGGLLPAQQPRACLRCGKLATFPLVDELPLVVKQHQVALLFARHTRVARDRAGRMTTPAWRDLVYQNLRGSLVEIGRSRRVLPFMGRSVDDFYPIAVALAEAWATAAGPHWLEEI